MADSVWTMLIEDIHTGEAIAYQVVPTKEQADIGQRRIFEGAPVVQEYLKQRAQKKQKQGEQGCLG